MRIAVDAMGGDSAPDVEVQGAIESIASLNGHEIVLVYEAKFVDPHFYEVESVKLQDNGGSFVAAWKPIDHFRKGNAPLYPDGLLSLLDSRQEP